MEGLTFKTDNRPLFDFSLEQVELAGWEMVNYTFDLHHSEYAEGNVMTEYEEKFSAMGNPICRMVDQATKKEITKTCKKRDSGAYYGSKIHAGVSYGKKKMWF